MSVPLVAEKSLVFYVEEESDDFTFFVQDRNGIIAAELEKLRGPAKPKSDESANKKQFSFAERIFIKNLILTEDGIRTCEKFWANLKGAAPNTPYQYLATLLKAEPTIAQCLKELAGTGPQGRDKKNLEDEILIILNQAVAGNSLESETWAIRKFSNRDQEFLDKLTDSKTNVKWKNRFILNLAFPDLIQPLQAGRGLICSSYVGNYLSITFRKITDDDGYRAGDYQNKQHKRKRNLFSLSEYCALLYKEIFDGTGSADHAHGLIVVTGATKSAKSEITRGLIQRYLDGKPPTDRRHHLVTFEDPVERFFVDEQVESPYPWAAVPLSTKSEQRDYTPREKPTDANLLEEALNDALRQTPRVFFVGETREKAAWKVLLDFAATGHLIITTAHAGSLVEAMHKIFEALEVKTPADRSEIATKLLGVIHIRGDYLHFDGPVNKEEGVEPTPTTILFPALWRRSPRGIASLTSDGLASLLPHRPRRSANASPAIDNSDEPSCLGRRGLIEQVFVETQTNDQLLAFFNNDAKAVAAFQTKAYVKAIEWDLQGV